MLQKRQLTFLDELEIKAKKILDKSTYDFIAGGAGSESGLQNNRDAFQRYFIVPHVLKKVDKVNTELTLLGKNLLSPILIAPCAFHKLVHAKGEVATAKAADRIGTIMTLSTMSSCTIEEVASVSNGSKWFQLYIFKDRAITEALVRRAECSGYDALVVTVDVPAMGMRLRDIRNQFKLPLGIEPANFKNYPLSSVSQKSEGSKIKMHTDQYFDPGLTWETVDWVASITKLPIILKGILNVKDAIESLNHNIAGIIVSNHGARQIDGVISALDILPDIIDALPKRIPVIVDGGIRSGEDVFKALALGATAVLMGRQVLWSLAIGGEEHLVSTFDALNQELALTMRLSGCASLSKIHEFGLSLLSSQSLTLRNMMKKLDLLSMQSEDAPFLKKQVTLFSRL